MLDERDIGDVDNQTIITDIALCRLFDGCLLPNLQRLEIEPETLSLASTLFSSSQPLTSLSLFLDSPPTGQDFIASLPELFPRLEKLTVVGPSPEIPHERLSSTIARLNNLQALACEVPLADAALMHLSRLPRLVSADLTLVGNARPWPDGAMFPTLETLVLCGSNTQVLGGLQGLACRALRSLRLAFDDELTPDVLAQACHAIASIGTTLSKLHITSAYALYPDDPDLTPCDVRCLEPLHALRGMKDVSIRVTRFVLDDGALGALAQWWPALERLEIDDAPSDAAPRPTIGALAHFITACGALRALSISGVDARAPPPAPRASGSLGMLFLKGHAPIEDAGSVGALLAAVAPNLTDLCYQRRDPKWEAVSEMLKTLSAT